MIIIVPKEIPQLSYFQSVKSDFLKYLDHHQDDTLILCLEGFIDEKNLQGGKEIFEMIKNIIKREDKQVQLSIKNLLFSSQEIKAEFINWIESHFSSEKTSIAAEDAADMMSQYGKKGT